MVTVIGATLALLALVWCGLSIRLEGSPYDLEAFMWLRFVEIAGVVTTIAFAVVILIGM